MSFNSLNSAPNLHSFFPRLLLLVHDILLGLNNFLHDYLNLSVVHLNEAFGFIRPEERWALIPSLRLYLWAHFTHREILPRVPLEFSGRVHVVPLRRVSLAFSGRVQVVG